MKKGIIFLLFFTITNLTFAQFANTTWVYQLDKDARKDNRQSVTTTLKLLNESGVHDTENLFGITLAKNIRAGKITIYKDFECTQPIPFSDVERYLTISFLDTIINTSPLTWEESSIFVRTDRQVLPSDDTEIRFYQTWSYDSKKHQITSIVEKIFVNHIVDNELFSRFYIKIDDDKKPATSDLLYDDNYTIVKRIEYHGDFSETDLSRFVFDEKHQTQNKLYSVTGNLLEEEKFTEDLTVIVDTIITFDPETFAEEQKIVRRPPMNLNEIGNYRVAQDIYIDPENMNIKVRILGIAPMRHLDYPDEIDIIPFAWIVYDKALFNR